MKNWPNLIRFTAIFFVILLHVSAAVSVEYGKVSNEDWLISVFYNSISRCSVPLFVMLTGGLILSKELVLKDFLKKRFTRIFWPWLFWSIIFISFTIYGISRKNELLNFDKLFEIFFSGLVNGSSYHLWYIYMILGLMLFMPILAGWIKNAKDIDLMYFLLLWFLVVCLKWCNVSLMHYHLFYFSDYIGYLVLGFVITNNRIPSFLNNKIVFIIGIISLSITFLLTIKFSFINGFFVQEYFDYLAPNVVIYSASIFYLLKNLQSKIPAWVNKTINEISDLSFGIYFIHVLFIYFVFKVFLPTDFSAVISIPLLSLIILVLSLVSIKLMRLLPFGKYYVG